MVPHGGVICLEVKGDSYDIRDGLWFRTHGDGNPEAEAPDKQAENAMNALKRYLLRAATGSDAKFAKRISRLPIWYALAFTDTTWDWPDNLQQPEGCLVLRATESLEGSLLCQKLSDYAKKDLPNRGGKYKPKLPIDGDTIDFVLRALARKREMRHVLTTAADLKQIDAQLLMLTEEQYEKLEDVQDEDGNIRNERVIVEGGAGTGKTMLAIQLARLRQRAGDKVLVVSAGLMLPDWTQRQLPGITVVRAGGNPPEKMLTDATVWPDFMKSYSPNISAATSPTERIELQSLYREDLQQGWCPWDYLVVDELQFFCSKADLEVLDLALKGGLADGHWTMFGDFAFQDWLLEGMLSAPVDGQLPANPRESESVFPKEYLRELCRTPGSAKRWFEPRPLKRNCRSTKPIALASARIVGQSEISVLPSNVAGPQVVYRFWQDVNELIALLSEESSTLSEAGVNH